MIKYVKMITGARKNATSFLIGFVGRLNVPRFQDDAEGFVVAME